MKRIDVILPFHRDDIHLHSAINSVAQSADVNLRLILVDDRLNQSSDISLDVNKKTPVKLVRTIGGQGYGAALQVGSNFLDSDFVALMNSDDLVHPDRFRIQQESLNGFDLNFTSLVRQSSRGHFSNSMTGDLDIGEYDPSFLLLGAYGANASWFMNRDWWLENAFFDNKAALDWRIALSSFRKSKIQYLHKPLYVYRRHKMQSTSSPTTSAQFDVIYNSWSEFHTLTLGSQPSRNIFDLMATPWIKNKCQSGSNLASWIEDFQSYSDSITQSVSLQASRLLRRRLALMCLQDFSNFSKIPSKYLKYFPRETWEITKQVISR